jgi:hypothetical protein
MKPLDVSPEVAEDLLVAIAAHVPPGVPLGRPALVTANTVVTAGRTESESLWWRLEPGGHVSVMVEDHDLGFGELARYCRGRRVGG